MHLCFPDHFISRSPFFSDLLVIDLFTDPAVDHPEDEQFDLCDDHIDDDGVFSGFARHDIRDLFPLRSPSAVMFMVL
jgi:spermidine synthase